MIESVTHTEKGRKTHPHDLRLVVAALITIQFDRDGTRLLPVEEHVLACDVLLRFLEELTGA